MKLRILLLSLFWAAMLSSCKEVSFKVPQPAGVAALQEVPEPLRGSYIPQVKTDEKVDTLIIESWGYRFKDSDDKDWLGRGAISDSLVVKFYQDYYFVNFREGDQWVLRLVKQLPDGGLEFLSIDLQSDETSKDKLKRLSRKIKYTEIKRGDDTFYQINPTPAQLMSLIKDGFFTGTTLAKKKN